MRYALLLFIMVGFMFQQNKFDGKQTCNVFDKKEKPIDTVKLTGELLEIAMMPQGSANIVYLEKKKMLPLRHHYFSIRARIDNCSVDYWLICGDNSRESIAFAVGKYPQKVKLTCLVIRDDKMPFNKGEPLIIVTKIRLIK